MAGKTPSVMRYTFSGTLHRALLLLIPFTTVALAQSGASFPGFAWGTPLRQIEHVWTLTAPEVDEPEVRYQVSVGRLGNSDIEECEFEFTDGLFSGIVMMTRGRENTEALLQFLESRFGKGEVTFPRFWQWMDEDTYVSLDEDSAGDGYVLWYGIHWQRVEVIRK